jgi:hypothetical protein
MPQYGINWKNQGRSSMSSALTVWRDAAEVGLLDDRKNDAARRVKFRVRPNSTPTNARLVRRAQMVHIRENRAIKER